MADQSFTHHVPDSPLDYTIEVRGTSDAGVEVVVSVVNEGEEPIQLTAVRLEYWIDDVYQGVHDVYFSRLSRREAMSLEQFEVESGRFHIAALDHSQTLRTRVHVDFIAGAGKQGAHSSHRLQTRHIVRKVE